MYTDTQDHKLLKEKKVMENMAALACNSENKHCDAVITVEGIEFHAHKINLCGCSAYFRALFTNGFYPIDQHMYSIPGVSAHIMELIIKHAYGQKITITEENVCELLIAADYLDISDLRNKCYEVLKAELRLETCIGIWHFAHLYSLEKLKHKAFQMILFNLEEIVCISDEFLDLTVEQLSEIIENDNRNIKNESVLLDAISKWTNHALQERKAQIGVLVVKVCTGLLGDDYFLDKVKKLEQKDEAFFPVIRSILSNKHLRPNPTQSRLFTAILLAMGASGNVATHVIEAYDSRADRWVHIVCSNRPAQHYYGTVFLNGFVYCIGGYDSGFNFLNSARRFEPMTRTWTKVSPMHYRRSHVAVCVLDGQIYAMGGINNFSSLNTVERYNPKTDQWSMIASMQQRRSQAGAATLNGKVYVCGGFGGSGSKSHLSTAEYYSPQMGQWTFITNMISRRSSLGLNTYRGELYVVGGDDSFISLCSAEVYNPQTNSWRNIPDMVTRRTDFGTGVIDDRLYVVGGYNGGGLIKDVEYYDLKAGKWYIVKEIRVSFHGLNYCVVSDLPKLPKYIIPQDSCTVLKRS